MSKRLTRIFAPAILSSLPRILGKEVHVVLHNGHTVFGALESLNSNLLIVNDLRDHVHEIKLSDVEEIILDHQTVRSATQA